MMNKGAKGWNVSKKRYPKTRTGCMTCRQRHLKCDELKPTCGRCRKDGRHCQGYQPIHVMYFEVLHGIEERRSYFYFFDNVAPVFSGHHEERFWNSILKQLAGRNVAIRHAIAALGSMCEHERLCSHDRVNQLRILSYEQYYKAVRRVEETFMSRDTSLVRVVCFVLFITIELKLGMFEHAQTLLRTALNMLERCGAEIPTTSTETDIANTWVSPMLIRLHLQINLTAGTSMLRLKPPRYVASNPLDFGIGTPFQSVDSAHQTLGSILRSIFSTIHFYASLSDPVNLERTIEIGRLLLDAWKTEFQSVSILESATRKRAILLLQIQAQAAEMILRTVVSTRDLPTRKEFAQQVDSCEEFLHLHSRSQRSTFFMDYALIPALFFSATRCPDAQVSEKALRLLKGTRWQEGFWSSHHAAEEAERILAIQQMPSMVDKVPSSDNEVILVEGATHLHHFEGCAWEFLSGHNLVLSMPIS